MSKKASNFQKKAMSRIYKGKQIFKPLNTGWIDDRVACVREWIANIFYPSPPPQSSAPLRPAKFFPSELC